MPDPRFLQVRPGVFLSWDRTGPRICHVDRPLDIFTVGDDLVRVIVQLRADTPVEDVFRSLDIPAEQYDAVWQALHTLVSAGMLSDAASVEAFEPVLRDSEQEGARRILAFPDIEELDPSFVASFRELSRSTLTSVPLAYALRQAVRHLVRTALPGAIIECGVWRGGSMALAARTLMEMGDHTRELWLYDTFNWQWDDPADCDGFALLGWLKDAGVATNDPHEHLRAGTSVDDVRSLLDTTGYPRELIHLVPGFAQDTIPHDSPDRIALLRLDTDLYHSTLHELEHLYPRLVPGGVLIVDDYGKLEGATQAVDEYFSGVGNPPLLHRVDLQGRIAMKPGCAVRLGEPYA